jgi:hypothetical protein
MMTKLSAPGIDAVDMDLFLTLFAYDEEPPPATPDASYPNSRRTSRRPSLSNPSAPVQKLVMKVPVLNVALAETYLNVRRAFDLLDVDSSESLTNDELEGKLIGNEEIRDLLKVELSDLDDVAKKMKIHSANGAITWELFRCGRAIEAAEQRTSEAAEQRTIEAAERSSEAEKQNRRQLQESTQQPFSLVLASLPSLCQLRPPPL